MLLYVVSKRPLESPNPSPSRRARTREWGFSLRQWTVGWRGGCIAATVARGLLSRSARSVGSGGPSIDQLGRVWQVPMSFGHRLGRARARACRAVFPPRHRGVGGLHVNRLQRRAVPCPLPGQVSRTRQPALRDSARLAARLAMRVVGFEAAGTTREEKLGGCEYHRVLHAMPPAGTGGDGDSDAAGSFRDCAGC